MAVLLQLFPRLNVYIPPLAAADLLLSMESGVEYQQWSEPVGDSAYRYDPKQVIGNGPASTVYRGVKW